MTPWKIFYGVTIKKKDLLRRLSNDDGDGNENGKKSRNRVRSTKQQLHTCLTLFGILSPSLQIYDVKLPNFSFYGVRESNEKTNLSFATPLDTDL